MFKVLFLYPDLMLQTTFPMGIAILSAVLKREGFSTDIFETPFYKTEELSSDEARVDNLQIARFDLGEEYRNLRTRQQMHEDLVKKVEEYKPDLLAVSIFEDLYPQALELLQTVKKFRIPTIAGGPFPTHAPEKVIKEGTIDMVCIGEGEGALSELCHKLAAGEDSFTIKNLWVKKDGKVIKNEVRKLRDLKLNPPPDFSLFDDRRFYKPMKGKVYRMALVETHRGCPYACAFCASQAISKLYKDTTGEHYFRIQDISKVRDELKILVDKYQVEFIYFPAEVFLAMSKDYLKEFKEMYKEFQLPFFCQSRAELINERTVRYLSEMNCHSLAMGIEQGNEEFRYKKLNRKVSNETYITAIKCLEKTDIKVSVNNIVGFPDETRELVFDTINLNRCFNVYQINAYYFTPYHGTALREYSVQKGYIDDNTQTINITKDTVLNMPTMSPDEIRGLVRTFTLYVKFPVERYSEIAIAEKFDDEGNKMFQRLQAEYWQKYLQ